VNKAEADLQAQLDQLAGTVTTLQNAHVDLALNLKRIADQIPQQTSTTSSGPQPGVTAA